MRAFGTTIFTALLLAASAAFLIAARDLGPGSRVIPLGVASSLSGLLVIQLVRDVRSARLAPALVATQPGLERAALGWLLALGALILGFGVSLGPPLFVCIHLRRRGHEAWPLAMAAGAATGLVYWLVMTQAIGAPTSLGALGALAESLIRVPASR